MLCGASIRPAPRVATLWRCLGPKADMYIVNGVAPLACDAAEAMVEPFRLFSEHGLDRVTPQTSEGSKHWVKFSFYWRAMWHRLIYSGLNPLVLMRFALASSSIFTMASNSATARVSGSAPILV